jgi:predicted lysophospholipase L1 biosynthesis ABC-type transport system permease subunit
VRVGPPGDLVLDVSGRELRVTLPDTRGSGDAFVVEYAEEWPGLPAGRVVWRIEDGGDNAAVFDLADQATVKRIRDRNWRVLTRDIPQRAQLFLRAHHFLSEGLLVQAGGQFARLAEAFPAEPYPRQQVWAVAKTLGVDPTALLR